MKFSYMEAVGYADNFCCSMNEYMSALRKHTPKGFSYWQGTDKDVDAWYEIMRNAERELNAIADVTNIPYWVWISASRLNEKFLKLTGYFYQDQEHLVESLLENEKEPEYGIYRNEYFEAATRRLYW